MGPNVTLTGRQVTSTERHQHRLWESRRITHGVGRGIVKYLGGYE